LVTPRLPGRASKIAILVGGLAAVVGIAACTPETSPIRRVYAETGPLPVLTPAPNVQGDPARGRALFTDGSIIQPSGCATCHTVRGVPQATGVAGPNLTNVTIRPTLAGDSNIPMNPDNLVRWIMNPQALKQGALMPSLGVSEAQARDLTAFLYSLPYNPPAP
jgi:cytochrome c1